MVRVEVVKPFEEIYVDGKRVIVREILAVTPTHIVVRHLDGSVEAIEIERVTLKKGALRAPQAVPA